MNYKIIFAITSLFFLFSCDDLNHKTIDFKPEKKYRNSGFALVYNDSLDDIKIWLTKDSLALPLIIEKKAKLGTIKMELVSNK